MRRTLLLIALLVGLPLVVQADNPRDTFEQITVDNTVGGVGFTPAKMDQSGYPQASVAGCRLETAEVRYTYDGTAPTSSVGTLLEVGDTLVLPGHDRMVRFRAIRTGTTSGQLDCTYSR